MAHKKKNGEKLKVLMLGWEFPPYSTGGLGTACHGLTKGLKQHDVEVTFILPKAPDNASAEHVKLVPASMYRHMLSYKDLMKLRMELINSPLTPYMNEDDYESMIAKLEADGKYAEHKSKKMTIYGRDLHEEVERYAYIVGKICKKHNFDVIHAHDWMTYKAGMNVKKKTGKPLVVHMHATEFDRTGGNGVNQHVYDIEREGMHFADAVCPVSNFTKNKIMHHYGVPEHKIHVVHNAVEFTGFNEDKRNFKSHDKIVLFLGRITLQKGPEYFVETAKKVLQQDPNVRFVVAGSGDMQGRMIEQAANYGIGDKMLFTGFLTGADIDRAFSMADVYVMPSVSEPFGITPLESMRNGTPCVISKQSGVSEVINHCFKVDFWDIDETANKVLGILNHPALKETMSEEGSREVRKFNWAEPAGKCIDVYKKVMRE